MTSGIFGRTQNNQSSCYETAAALLIAAVSSDCEGADAALRSMRVRAKRGEIDIGAIADRVRGRASFQPLDEAAPAFLAMPLGERRKWLDAIALRLRLTGRERSSLRDTRAKALSSTSTLTSAQVRMLQNLVDRAWKNGVRP